MERRESEVIPSMAWSPIMPRPAVSRSTSLVKGSSTLIEKDLDLVLFSESAGAIAVDFPVDSIEIVLTVSLLEPLELVLCFEAAPSVLTESTSSCSLIAVKFCFN